VKSKVVIVGRAGCVWSDKAVAEYTKRLRRYGGVEESFVKAESFRGDVDRVRSKEGERLLKHVGPRDRLVVLDERGLALDTHQFTKMVDSCRQGGVPNLIFAVGGPYGHDPILRQKAWKVVRLSSMVLNHDVARVVLYEQLYRAMAILHNVPYHH